MKKYIPGILALIIAISLTAFRTESKENLFPEPTLYWYPVNSAGQITSGSYILDERADVVAMGGLCVELSGTLCKKGFTDIVPPEQFNNPPAQSGDIRKE